jgi:hypothetical protein
MDTTCAQLKEVLNEGKQSFIQYLEAPGGDELFELVKRAVHSLPTDQPLFQQPQQYVSIYLGCS